MKEVAILRGRVRSAIAESGLSLAGGRVVVAVSGGADSTVLLDIMDSLRGALGVELCVATFDHGLRVEAAAEVRGVVAECRRRGIEVVARKLTFSGNGADAARRARYDALIEIARGQGAAVVVVAHTEDDQAETVLDRLVRGAGSDGLSAMAPVRRLADDVTLLRPMLEITRAEVEAYARARSLAYVEDPTNRSLAYRRARLRHEVLPLLEREHSDVRAALARSAARLRDDAELLEALAEREYARLARAVDRDGVAFDVDALLVLPRALFGRVIARAARQPSLGQTHIEAIRRLLSSRAGSKHIDVPGGWIAERRYGTLILLPRPPAVALDAVEVTHVGTHAFGATQVEIDAELWAARRAGESLWLRSVQPGDRIVLRGIRKKVHDVMVDAKIPRGLRAQVPLLVRRDAEGNESVVWMPA